MTKEEILKQFQAYRTKAVSDMLDNPKDNGIYRTTDCYADLDSALLKALDQYATQIVLDKLPDSNEILNCCPTSSINTREQWRAGVAWMKKQATQRITTREEVEKPYRELLVDILEQGRITPEIDMRINKLLNT